jgi:serpin B
LPEGDAYDYAAALDGETFLKLYDKRKKAQYNAVEISAKMPHFSFECTVGLVEVLSKMGMPSAFSGATADFRGLGTSSKGNLFIDNAIQKTFIELDNSGTRAAAVTAITMVPECAPAEKIEYYRVELDRPFVYAIIDTENGLPIFVGVCEKISNR